MKVRRIDKLLFASFLALSPCGAFAQDVITGTVVDSSGEPVIGATIKEGNTNNATVSDLDGKFTIKLNNNSSPLMVSYVGMKNKKVNLKGKTEVSVVLQDDSNQMNEVVVIGYGTAKRKDLTGSVASVDSRTLGKIPTTSAASALTGRLAGVSVVTTEGSPDAAVNIRVRGGGSITQDNSPLYIVDGFQVSSLDDVPPGDIESIDVLKDAASTAIYGSKGANGVILVTTKSGKEGKVKVTFNASVGFNKLYGETDVLSPYEFVYYQRELDPSDNAGWFGKYGRWEDIDIYKSQEGTNWQKKLFSRTGVKQSYNLGMTGGTKDMRYSISYTHDDESYIMKTSKFRRDNLNLKLSKDIRQNLTLDFNVKMTNTIIDGASVSNGKKLRDCVKYSPVKTLSSLGREDLGEDDVTENLSSLNDPFYNIANEYRKQRRFNNVYQGSLTWRIIKGLSLRGEGAYGFSHTKFDDIYLKNTGEAAQKGGQPVGKRTYTDGNNYTLRAVLSYDTRFLKKHRLNAQAGAEMVHSQSDNMDIKSDYFPIDYTADNVLAMWNDGTAQPTYTTINEPSRTASYFGRVNYIFDNRYYLTLTAREDGTNVFSPGNKWGFFPAVAGAWRISEEKFMKGTKEWLSNLKLRLSYGATGNARVKSYWRQTYQALTKNLYYQDEKPLSSLQTSTVLRNENLTWETTYSANAGLDINLFNGRLDVSLDVYNNKTKNLIMAVDLPSNSGYDKQYQNLGQTTNKGFEANVKGIIVDRKDFYLGANFNISFNKNRVDKLYGGQGNEMIVSSGRSGEVGADDYRVFEGQEIGLIWGYKTDGMYSFDDFTYNATKQGWELNPGVVDASNVLTKSSYFGPGFMKLKKLSGDGTEINPDEDRTVIGHALPKFTGGFGLETSWKGFDLAAMFNFSVGNDVLNANKIDYTTYAGGKRYQNVSTEIALGKRFTIIDPETGQNIFNGRYANPERLQELNKNASIWSPLIGSTIVTDWAVEDGSFLRLGTLTLGYTLPKLVTSKIGLGNVRFYATGYNLFCITGYSGQDPEVSTSTNNLCPGIDCSAYPKSRTYIIGMNVTF